MKAVPYGYDPASGLGFKIDTVMLAGLQILAGLEYSVSLAEYTDDLAMQVSGLSFEYDVTRAPMDPAQLITNFMTGVMEWGRVDPFSIRVNGQPLDFVGVYWVALNETLHGFWSPRASFLMRPCPPGCSCTTWCATSCPTRGLLDYRSEGRVIDTSVH